MADKYELRDLHEKRVLVEMNFVGQIVRVEGIADYYCGELRIPIEDSAGNFTVLLQEATWTGQIHATLEGNRFLIRLHESSQG